MERFRKEYQLNKNPVSFLILVFYSMVIMGQKSIHSGDVEIHTQLTFLNVSPEDVVAFEKGMGKLSFLAKEVKLEETFDWLTYKSDTDQYLIVNFSNGLMDVLTLKDYGNGFNEKGSEKAFGTIMQSMLDLHISVEKNYIIQMLLPWSTVKAISVAEFPLATMVDYEIPIKQLETFDFAMRELAELLKNTKYPYPLESNRGYIGAYNTMALVWFYDNRSDFLGKDSPSKWMEKHGQKESYERLMETLETISASKKEYHLDYMKALSY